MGGLGEVGSFTHTADQWELLPQGAGSPRCTGPLPGSTDVSVGWVELKPRDTCAGKNLELNPGEGPGRHRGLEQRPLFDRERVTAV